jgi:2,4-dichlorophenol 6-monooxygenase
VSSPDEERGLNLWKDSYNLAWKLSLVIKGKADARILNTYECERRAIGRRNVDWGLFTFQNSAVINAVIGLVPGQTTTNRARFAKLFEDSEIGAALRAQTAKIIDSQRIEFSAHNIELGFKYGTGGFVIDDGTEPEEYDPLGQTYVPSTRPGSRLPHAWIEVLDRKMGTHDVAGRDGGFALFTDDDGEDWISAATRFATITGIAISTAQFGPLSHHFKDCDDVWANVKGIKRGGALLVRPDNIVAWRSLHKSRTGGRELTQALEILFGRNVGGANGVNGVKIVEEHVHA